MGGMLDLFCPSKGEIDVFVEQYFPETDVTAKGPNWRHRHQGLTLTLRALQAEQNTTAYKNNVPVEIIRFAMARGTSHDGKYLIFIEDCAQTAGWWMGLQLRQYFRATQLTALRLCESWAHRATQKNEQRDVADCADSLGQQLVGGATQRIQSKRG